MVSINGWVHLVSSARGCLEKVSNPNVAQAKNFGNAL